MTLIRSLLGSTLAVVLLLATACGGDGSSDATTNGVNDLRKACEIRATWTRGGSAACVDCMAAAPSPPCDCSRFKEVGGKCNAQRMAARGEPSCEGTAVCVGNCATDCTCVEACYAGKPACRERASAEDGCVAEVCSETCR